MLGNVLGEAWGGLGLSGSQPASRKDAFGALFCTFRVQPASQSHDRLVLSTVGIWGTYIARPGSPGPDLGTYIARECLGMLRGGLGRLGEGLGKAWGMLGECFGEAWGGLFYPRSANVHTYIHRYVHTYLGKLGRPWEAWEMLGHASGRLGECLGTLRGGSGRLGEAWGPLGECFVNASGRLGSAPHKQI